MRSAVPFGFRRSLAPHAARAGATLIAVVLVGQGGWGPSAVTAGQAARSHAARDVPGAARGLETPPRADLAVQRPVDPPASSVASDAAGLQPSVQFEEAEAHKNDRIDFAPGARVAVGFTPGRGDRWKVGGADPAALPAGRLDGKTIRAQGRAQAVAPSSTAEPATPAPSVDPSVDTPNAGRSATIAASAASWFDQEGATTVAPTIEPQAPVTPRGLRREIFGFLPYWQLNSSSLRLDYSKISTIAYFGVGADGAGNIVKKNPDGSTSVGWSGWASARMSSVITTAHANHTRVVLTVQSFGWNTSGLARQKALLGSPTNRLNLARQIAAAVRDRGADGVNLDFEPLAPGYHTQFTALVRTIRAQLNRIHAGYQLTFDTTGSIGNYPIEAATAPGGADAIFIMGYDYRNSASSPVGSVAPLDRAGYGIADTIAAYVRRVPASRLILGVPYYGRAWSTATSLLNASNTSGIKFGASTTVNYATAADYLAQYGRKYDPLEQVAWTAYRRRNCTATYGCVMSWRQLYVDDAAALNAKYDLVNRYGLRGAGIWALGYDGTRPELWQAIQLKFVTDTTPPVITRASGSGSLLSPNGDGLYDTVKVAIIATGATGWKFTASPLSGTATGPAVVTRTGPGGSAAVTWDGRTTAGALAPDGAYQLALIALDQAGNRATRTWTVRVDTTRPTLGGIASPARFSPNGDGALDRTRLRWSSSEPISGTARLLRGTAVIRSWPIRNVAAGGVTWSGTDVAGRRVPDGTYTYRVTGRDAAGNSGTASFAVVVDRTLSNLRWAPGLFYPQDRDRLAGTSKSSFSLARTARVTMAIYQGSTLVRTVVSNRSMAAGPHSWVWNGRNAAGALVAPGRYTMQVAARTSLGTSVLTRTVIVDAFSVALSATTIRSGQTLTVIVTTAEPLRSSPAVSFGQTGRAAVTKATASLGGGRYRVSFVIAPGAGPAVIRITGRDTSGGTNTTSATVTVQ
jgi:spore germination protein YaaH/flagellar hook assembly protein FlgD